MLSNIRKFSSSIWAKMLLGIIIIPFVFWGMGGVFSGGNKNTLAKINKDKISTQDFINHINSLNLTQEIINKEIDNGILEKMLGDLVRKKILSLEINKLKIKVPDLALLDILKKNKNFLDENNNFSRVKYEKYLITNNMTAAMFEENVRAMELKKLLFYYISGGVYPSNFMVNKKYNDQNKKINLKGIKIEEIYIKEDKITQNDINNYINLNKDKLNEKYLSLSLAKITPQNLVSSEEFNNLFFEKIDEIEQKITDAYVFEQIIKNYNLKTININSLNENNGNLLKEHNISELNIDRIINKTKINDIKLIDNGNDFIIININKINNLLPDINDGRFRSKIKKLIINNNKFDINKSLIKKINTNSFTLEDFSKISKENNLKVENFELNSIKDKSYFDEVSMKEIYKSNAKSFVFGVNNNYENYLLFIDRIHKAMIDKKNEQYKKYIFETNVELKSNIYSSYDEYLQKKYKITINEKTLNTVKNYFK